MNNIQVKENLVVEEIDNMLIIFDVENDRFFEMDELGSFIWKKLDNGSSDDVVSAVCDEYDVDEEIAKKDTFDFIDNLLKNDLIIEME